VWQEALRWHPDSDFVHDVLSGIEFGRPMGYTGDRLLQRHCRNPAAHEVNQPQLHNIRSAEFEQGWRPVRFLASPTTPDLCSTSCVTQPRRVSSASRPKFAKS